MHGLLHTDYTVIEAAYGSEGIRKAMKYVPDLIISDVMMPGMDGIECCRRLKSELQTCHIPVILLTACSLDEHEFKGMMVVQILISPSLSVRNYYWHAFVI